jgi:hypothetical protein
MTFPFTQKIVTELIQTFTLIKTSFEEDTSNDLNHYILFLFLTNLT